MANLPLNTGEIVRRACRLGIVVPAFNTYYLPMIEPIVQAVVDQDSFALIETARIEWLKNESLSPSTVVDEFRKREQKQFVRLHLDHVPVIDEDLCQVDYVSIIQEALDLGYKSVMVDGSRLDLEGNIAATRLVAELAHQKGIPCEAELGAVLGHGAGPLPPYDELFASGMGFTQVEEARRFVQETRCDWLSVAVGTFHGTLSAASKDQKKAEARINLDLLDRLREACDVPFVLHGGSGVRQEYVLAAVKRGIAKINIATEVRQAYEAAFRESGSVAAGQAAVYERTSWLLHDFLQVAGTNRVLTGSEA
jgi:ketose-bisphosphate aldolase